MSQQTCYLYAQFYFCEKSPLVQINNLAQIILSLFGLYMPFRTKNNGVSFPFFIIHWTWSHKKMADLPLNFVRRLSPKDLCGLWERREPVRSKLEDKAVIISLSLTEKSLNSMWEQTQAKIYFIASLAVIKIAVWGHLLRYC